MFVEGEFVDVQVYLKVGFVVKRHGFGVGQATHGQHNRLRAFCRSFLSI
jgi:large subunit ribosomal protein L3